MLGEPPLRQRDGTLIPACPLPRLIASHQQDRLPYRVDSWYRFLQGRGATEVNFWQPSGGRRFGAIPEGAPFLFKSHYSHGNRIVGGGFLSGWASLPMTRAWEFFGEDNGCATLEEMRTQIRKYRNKTLDDGCADPEIGCFMLRDVRFFDPDEARDAPPGWSGNIVQGRSYDLASPEGSYVEQVLGDLLRRHLNLVAADGADQGDSDSSGPVPGEVFGQPRLTPVRVGQAAFKALVQEAYGRRCAVTGDKIVPVLQAAHIRPVTDHGENRDDNGSVAQRYLDTKPCTPSRCDHDPGRWERSVDHDRGSTGDLREVRGGRSSASLPGQE